MSDEDETTIQTATHEAEIEIAPGLVIRVLVLDDGQRVISDGDMGRVLVWLCGDREET